ncbi:hypothetical protein ACJ67_06940 [Methylophilus sp. TWE2]|nr:hypothetical protein ACJ67_06940 [Methylophilus sp. TWE2]
MVEKTKLQNAMSAHTQPMSNKKDLMLAKGEYLSVMRGAKTSQGKLKIKAIVTTPQQTTASIVSRNLIVRLMTPNV